MSRLRQWRLWILVCTFFSIGPSLSADTPWTDGFDYPVGKPNASGYYNAQDFGVSNHLGEDWNGNGGGDSDLGDPVYAASNGEVAVSNNFGGPNGWGNVVMLWHDTPEGIRTTMYAHMNERMVSVGDHVGRGQTIGTIGKTGGPWGANNSAHLHFELRLNSNTANGSGYGSAAQGQTDPSNYIDARRPPWGGSVTPPSLVPGDCAVTKNTAGVLKVRESPNGTDTGQRLGDGVVLKLLEGPVQANGIWWYRHDHGGWSAFAVGSEVYMSKTQCPGSPPGIIWTAAPPENRWYCSNERLSYHVNGGTDPIYVRETAPGHDATYQTRDGYIDLNYANPGWNEYRATASNDYGNAAVSWVGGWDPNAPSATKTGGADAGKWYTSPATVNWSVADAQSGVKSQMYRWNGGTWTGGSGSTDILEGKNALEVRVEDNAWNGGTQEGNVAVVNLGEYWRDTAGPIIQVTGAAPSTWINGSASIGWNITDAASGVATITVQWDGGSVAPVDGTGSVTLTEGRHTASFRAIDEVGNVSTATAGPYWVDTTAPTLAVTLNPAQADGQNGWYFTTPVMTVSASDPNGTNASGLAGRFYTLNGQEEAYTTPMPLSGDGTKDISARAIDVAGNAVATPTTTVKVDSTPPVLTSLTTNSPSGSLSAVAASWSGSDATSGVSTYEYRIGTSDFGSEIRGRTEVGDVSYFVAEDLMLTSGQTYYITVRVRDIAGMWSSPVTKPFVAVAAKADQAPNFNNGGVSDTSSPRASPNYRVVDSLGQFAVDTSTSANYIVESGYWHTESFVPPSFRIDDVYRALRIAGGLIRAESNDMVRLNVVGGTSANRIDILDATTILRRLGPSAPATSLSFKVQPYGGFAGTAFTTQPVVQALDATGNPASDYTGPVTVSIYPATNPVGAVLTGTTTVNAVAGIATFYNLGISISGTGYILTAKSGTLTPADSQPFNIALIGTVDITRAGVSILLDGAIDVTEWGSVPSLSLGATAQDILPGNWTGAADYQGALQLQWDDDYLFVAMRVTDDVLSFSTTTTNALWAWDGLELFLGLDNPQIPFRTSYGPGDYQIMVSAINEGGTMAGAWYSPQSPGFIGGKTSLVKVIRTTHSYTIEAAIPWLALDNQMDSPLPGQLIGFNAMGKDNDHAYGTEDSAFSLSGMDSSSFNPSHWTTGRLLP